MNPDQMILKAAKEGRVSVMRKPTMRCLVGCAVLLNGFPHSAFSAVEVGSFHREFSHKQSITTDDLIVLKQLLAEIRSASAQEISEEDLVKLTRVYLGLDAARSDEPFALLLAQRSFCSVALERIRASGSVSGKREIDETITHYLALLKGRLIKNHQKARVVGNVGWFDGMKWSSFFASGMDPDAIEDPEFRAQYKAAIAKNSAAARRNSYQAGLAKIVPEIEGLLNASQS